MAGEAWEFLSGMIWYRRWMRHGSKVLCMSILKCRFGFVHYASNLAEKFWVSKSPVQNMFLLVTGEMNANGGGFGDL